MVGLQAFCVANWFDSLYNMARLYRTVCSYADSKGLVLQNVATISAGNDRVIGDMIAEALDKVRLAC